LFCKKFLQAKGLSFACNCLLFPTGSDLPKENEMSQGKKLEERWTFINQELREMGCPGELSKIRPYQDGANEILRIVTAHKSFMPFFMDVSFEYLKAFSGDRGIWHIRFNTGMIIVPMIDGKVLLKKEHRPTTGTWTWEVPRGFANLISDEVDVTKDSLKVIAGILKSEVGNEAFLENPKVVEIKQLHEGVWENTGTSVCKLPIYLVEISAKVDGEMNWKKQKISWKLFSLDEAKSKVNDLQSLVALSLM
jgi:hypothetical protein